MPFTPLLPLPVPATPGRTAAGARPDPCPVSPDEASAAPSNDNQDDRPFRSPEAHASFLERAREHAEEQAAWWRGEIARLQAEEAIARSRRSTQAQIRQALYEDGDFDMVGSRQRYEAGE